MTPTVAADMPVTTRTGPDTVQLDHTFDVRQRLDDLATWKAGWEAEVGRLVAAVRALDETRRESPRMAAHIATLRKRATLTLVRRPIELARKSLEGSGTAELRANLAPQYAALSTEEKLLWMQNFVFVFTPDFREALAKVETIRQHRAAGQQRNFLLGGHSGMGKTTFLDWLTTLEPARVEEERNRVPVIKIDAPVSNHTPKFLLQRIIRECGRVAIDRDNEEELLAKIALYTQKCDTELLIVDEVQQIKRLELKRRLVELSNAVVTIPIICASCRPTDWAKEDTDEEIMGRWDDQVKLEPFRGERLRQLLAFLELLLPFAHPSLLAGGETAKQIERWTRGLTRDVMILLVDASRRAILRGEKALDLRTLTEAWKRIKTQPTQAYAKFLEREATPPQQGPGPVNAREVGGRE